MLKFSILLMVVLMLSTNTYALKDLVRPLCVAHRGASGAFPENTILAFKEADKMGADGFELDLRITADDVVVVLHDETLLRTTNCTGIISNRSYYGYVDSCIAGGVEPVPTLKNLLDYLVTTQMFAYFDIKAGQRCIDVMANELNNYPVDLSDRIFLGGQNEADVEQLTKVAPRFKRSIVISDLPEKPTSFDVVNYNTYFQAVTPAFVKECNTIGTSVFGWTINDEETMREAISTNIDAVLTDYPDRFISVRDRF